MVDAKYNGYKHIATINYDCPIGVTEPKYALLDEGTQAIVKLFNGPQGNLALFNEYVCYKLALLINIPMPNSGICIMDLNTRIDDEISATSKNYGLAFYSEYMPKVTKLIPGIVDRIQNLDIFPRILLFDHIIFNTDRNEGNLLVTFRKNEILLKVIDHTHVFVNQTVWDSQCLRRSIKERDILSTKVLDNNDALYSMFFQRVTINKNVLEPEIKYLQKQLNRTKIQDIVYGSPSEWSPTPGDEDALVDYICYRVDNLDTICSTITSSLL